MIPPFDIFYVESDGELIWQCRAETLEIARLRVKTLLAVQLPGDYVIWSQHTGHKMTVKADGSIAPFLRPRGIDPR